MNKVKFLYFLTLLSVLLALFLSQCSQSGISKSTSNPVTTTDSICNTLAANSKVSSLAMDLVSDTFYQSALEMVQNLVNAPIEVQVEPMSRLQRLESDHVNFQFTIGEIPLCQLYARVSQSKERTVLSGFLPSALPQNISLELAPEVWTGAESEKFLNESIKLLQKNLASVVLIESNYELI